MGRCEYCHFPERFEELPFHVEHIVAKVHHLDNSLNNLAWACPNCNLHKGPNLVTLDPESKKQVNLFNPRTSEWDDHFTTQDGRIVGLSPCGRGTARLLNMNDDLRVDFRRELIRCHEFDR